MMAHERCYCPSLYSEKPGGPRTADKQNAVLRNLLSFITIGHSRSSGFPIIEGRTLTFASQIYRFASRPHARSH